MNDYVKREDVLNKCIDSAKLCEYINEIPSADVVSREDYEGLELVCKNFEEALNGLDEKLDELQYPWIPVTERLPEPGETVLAFRVFGVHGQLSEVCIAHTLKMFDRINWSMVGVTHWMPLPEPPTIIEAEEKDVKE